MKAEGECKSKMKAVRSAAAGVLVACSSVATAAAQLAPEPMSVIETLPNPYPEEWVFAHDLNFYSLLTGRVFLVDPTSTERDVHAIADAGQFASVSYSKDRHELYVAETFYSRGAKGDRSDFLTIYDGASFAQLEQLPLPGGKRSMSVTQPRSLQQTRDGKFLLIFNFTPAASVSVLDLDRRALVHEITIPGCMLIYPMGDRGFGSMCGDGSFIAFDLGDDGKPLSEKKSDKIVDVDEDPVFMMAATVGDALYFPSFNGAIQTVIPKDGALTDGGRHRLAGPVRDTEHGAKARPSGWQVVSSDEDGLVYVLMRPNAGEGDHKFGGSFVWAYDPQSQTVTRELPLVANSVSIQVTGGEKPMLVAANEAMHLDVYDLKSGEHLREIGGWGPATPYTMHSVR
ncbi:MAG: amine dehydrogenase large subunit [Pseudomonadota bacterium]